MKKLLLLFIFTFFNLALGFLKLESDVLDLFNVEEYITEENGESFLNITDAPIEVIAYCASADLNLLENKDIQIRLLNAEENNDLVSASLSVMTDDTLKNALLANPLLSNNSEIQRACIENEKFSDSLLSLLATSDNENFLHVISEKTELLENSDVQERIFALQKARESNDLVLDTKEMNLLDAFVNEAQKVIEKKDLLKNESENEDIQASYVEYDSKSIDEKSNLQYDAKNFIDDFKKFQLVSYVEEHEMRPGLGHSPQSLYLLKNDDKNNPLNKEPQPLGNIVINSHVSDKSNFVFGVVPTLDRASNITGNPFDVEKNQRLSELRIQTVTCNGKEYNLDEFIPLDNADGSYTFRSVATAQDKAALEKIVSQLSFSDISKLADNFPAIKKLDQYLIKEVDLMKVNEFINRYNSDENFKQQQVVAKKIETLVDQIELQEVSNLFNALSDNHFVNNYEKFHEKLKGQLVIQKFEARLEKLSSNKNFMSSLPDATKKTISAHLSQIKNTNEQVSHALRIEKLCNNRTLTSSEKNEILELGKNLYENKHGLISKIQDKAFDCSKFFETHAKLLDDQYQTKYRQILQQPVEQQINSLIKLSSDIANDKKLFIHFDAIVSRDRNRFYRQTQELDNRLRNQENKISEQNKAISNILSPELFHMLNKLEIKLEEAPKYTETSLQWENQQQINKLLNQSADVFKTLEATLADTDFKESLKILPLAQQINVNNPEIAIELLEGFKSYLTQYGTGVKNEIVDQFKGQVTDTAIGVGITAGKMAITYLAPQFALPYYIGKALYATYKANGIYTSSKQILNDLTELYSAVNDGNPKNIGKYSVRCVSDLASILLSQKTKATSKNKLSEFENAIQQGVKDAKNRYNLDFAKSMSDFLKTPFGKTLQPFIDKLKYKKGSDYGNIKYVVSKDFKQSNLKRGDIIYMDKLHGDHIEVFNKHGKVKFVLNIDGSQNFKKTNIAIKENRKIDI